jgi:hypothetical protein
MKRQREYVDEDDDVPEEQANWSDEEEEEQGYYDDDDDNDNDGDDREGSDDGEGSDHQDVDTTRIDPNVPLYKLLQKTQGHAAKVQASPDASREYRTKRIKRDKQKCQ